MLTIGYQVIYQSKSDGSAGVTPWLFVGQVAASAAFTVYSVLIGNVMFMATNALLILSALVGLGIWLDHRG